MRLDGASDKIDEIDDKGRELTTKCCSLIPEDQRDWSQIQQLITGMEIEDDRPPTTNLPIPEIVALTSRPQVDFHRAETILNCAHADVLREPLSALIRNHTKDVAAAVIELAQDDILTMVNFLDQISDVVNGLQYLHALGVVHGDLKEENVLISDKDRGLITDFDDNGDEEKDEFDWDDNIKDVIDNQAGGLIMKCFVPELRDRPDITSVRKLVTDLKIWDDCCATKVVSGTDISKLRVEPEIDLRGVEELLGQENVVTRVEADSGIADMIDSDNALANS
ncbi:hypothetical protein AN958_08744 [Leucoagaricus sp. SymC.cos]|nr:hypothetical protein AN958_08744 [Leucoagaricus sp. SymC.cos]